MLPPVGDECLLGWRWPTHSPDVLVRIDDSRGRDDPLNLIVEVTGALDKDKEAKAATARSLRMPAANNAGTRGRRVLIEIGEPCDA